MNHRVVAIDLDGVLAEYSGWKDEHMFGDPVSGAREFCQKLIDDGYTVIVYTCREVTRFVEHWLKGNRFPVEVSVYKGYGKPRAKIYIDDRGITFTGNFDKLWQDIQNFKPWWKEIG